MLARTPRSIAALSSCLLFAVLASTSVLADNVAQPLPFSQDWTNAALITANDNWSGVAGIEGFRGDGLAAAGVDPQTVLVADDPGVIDVNANQTNPSVFNTGGPAEFAITDPVVALAGSGTAQAPYLRLYLNTVGQSNVTILYRVRDLDGSTDNSVQPLALQYRVGASGTFTNVPAAFVADGSSGPSLATLETPVCVVLPSAVDNQALVQLRIMTNNASGNDEFLGIDDILVNTAGCGSPTPDLTVTDVSQVETNAGTTVFNFSVNLSAPAGPGGVTFDIATADGTAQDDVPATEDNDYVAQSLTGQTIPAGSSSFAFNVTVNGDTAVEPNENFFVNVTNVTGATAVDAQGQGTINNDDSPPDLSVTDVILAEGTGGTTIFTFAVNLSAPALAGGVTFDIATADGTAQDDNPATEDNDYVAQSLTGQTIAAGSSTYSFNVTVNADSNFEPNETFFVNVSNVVGAVVVDAQGLGTINNDDASLTFIHDIQGPGASSPIVGSIVTTRGIVTGRRGNGFFMQEPDVSVDADPSTSEGILVFTSSAPPATAAVGALVEVTGTVLEFVPAQDPFQPPLTELTLPTVVQISTGNPLPTAIPLTTSFPDPAGPHDQLERLEGMRVSLASLTVGAPTQGNISEANATATSTGVFQGVVTGNARAFREPGIQAPDPAPAGSTIPPLPRFDSNPEVIRVDADALGNPTLNVATGAVVTGLIGPLDYTFRRYTILPETGTPPTVVGTLAPLPVTLATSAEVTIASYNLQRFYDTVDAPGTSDVVLTPAAFDLRLNKASLAIRNFLRTPDILGVVEMENLSTLQALATRISADAIAASQPNPLYQAFLIEGQDVGGIDVGFLVKTAPVTGLTPRVTVNAVTQQLAGTLFVNMDASTEPLNDRPPLVLDAVVNNATGQSYPLVVIVNHLRSLNNSADPAPGSNGWSTVGERVRAKRQEQAEDLANLIQARQISNPSENLVLVGDFNAFEFNDGLGDSMNVITGTPVPDNQTAVPGDGIDLVNPNLSNLFTTVPANQRYSFVFDGNAQSLDHVVAGSGLLATVSGPRVEYARINADFPEVDRGTAAVQRGADHDPSVLFIAPLGFATTDLSISKTDSPDPVTAGNQLTYTIAVSNTGAINAASSNWTDTLPVGTTFVSLNTVAGWSCTTPAVGGTGTVSCSNPSFAPGTANYTLVVAVDANVAAATVISNTAAATTTTPDSNSANNSATATTTVAASADLSITVTDSADPVIAGSQFSYTLAVNNAGPSNAATVTLADTLPPNTTFVSLASPGGWSCTTPAVGAAGTVNCSIASLAPGPASFTLTVAVDAGIVSSTMISNTATVSSSTTDPTPADNSDTETTTINPNLDVELSITLSDSPDPVIAGEPLTYVATVSNAGPASAAAVTVSIPFAAGTSFASATVAGGGTCVAMAGTVECSFTGTVDVGGANSRAASITVNVAPSVLEGSVLTVTASTDSANNEPNTANNTAMTSTDVMANANLIASLSVAPSPATLGGLTTLTGTVTNTGPSDAQDVQLVVVVPAGLGVESASGPGAVCTSVPSGATTTVTCVFAGATVPGQALVASIQLRVNAPPATAITAVASSTTSDSVPANNNASVALLVLGTPSALQVPSLDARGLLLLLSLMLVIGGVQLRRRD